MPRQLGLQRPVLDWHEREDVALAVDDHSHRHRLDAAGGQAAPDLASEEGADRVADEAIEHAARLLGIDAVHIDAARVVEGIQDRAARDFVKLDAADLLVVLGVVEAEGGYEVPGDRLALAIRVGRQQDGRLATRLVLEAFDDVLAILGDHVVGLELVLDVHAQSTGRQIADMAEAGAHGVVASQKFLDRFGLGGRFDHHQALLCHSLGCALPSSRRAQDFAVAGIAQARVYNIEPTWRANPFNSSTASVAETSPGRIVRSRARASM